MSASTTSKKRPEEAKLEALAALDPATDRRLQNEAISQALQDRHYRVVARAATLAGERGLGEREKDLLAAYPRFLEDPAKKDPHCLAKAAITGALLALECRDTGFWLAGMRYRQPEPVWRGSSDTAVDVRCNCALGLVNTGHYRAMPELAILLHDPEKRVRAGAVRAISCGNPNEAEPLLRFKVLVGDEEAEILGECFTALLAIAAEESVPFVAARLRDAGGVGDYAALALGESRHPSALSELQQAWNEPFAADEVRATLARAAAVHRSETAFDWLISIIADGHDKLAEIAADALSVYDRNTQLMQRVAAARASRAGNSRDDV